MPINKIANVKRIIDNMSVSKHRIKYFFFFKFKNINGLVNFPQVLCKFKPKNRIKMVKIPR